MATLCLYVPEALNDRIAKFIKQKGFASKAEFFRSAAINYIDFVERTPQAKQEKLNFLKSEMQREIEKDFKFYKK